MKKIQGYNDYWNKSQITPLLITVGVLVFIGLVKLFV